MKEINKIGKNLITSGKIRKKIGKSEKLEILFQKKKSENRKKSEKKRKISQNQESGKNRKKKTKKNEKFSVWSTNTRTC